MSREQNSVAVIMAGGAGTRFWPLSTKEKPKQFTSLFGERSLLQRSYERIYRILPPERIFVLTNTDFTDLVSQQLPELPLNNIIGEPERKDTAAAVCLGALIARQQYGNPVMMVLTADHLIEPIEEFQKTLISAVREARDSDALYTFGIKPTFAATGYGYLELGEPTLDDDGIAHFRLASFREKPDLETAHHYLNCDRYLWNSGMFVWTVEAIIKELRRNIPKHLELLQQSVAAWKTPDWNMTLQKQFSALSKVSIDYAVMEKAADVRCVKGAFSWEDMGSWLAMERFLSIDQNHNHCHGRVHSLESRDNLIFCRDKNETVAVIGVNNLVVVRDGNKTLVVDKKRLEEVKRLTENL